MHLVKVAFEKTGTPPDFMLFMGWEDLPAYYFGIESFAYLLFVVILVTLSISLIFGYFSFRSRVTGVYFAIITQALVYMAMLFMFRNDTGFGGNNGMTGFSEIFGLNFRENKTATVLCGISLAVLGLSLLGCKKLVDAPLGLFLCEPSKKMNLDCVFWVSIPFM